MKAYCSNKKIDPKDINDEQNKIIIEWACVHIGFYIEWIINNNLEVDMHKEYDSKDLIVEGKTILGFYMPLLF